MSFFRTPKMPFVAVRTGVVREVSPLTCRSVMPANGGLDGIGSERRPGPAGQAQRHFAPIAPGVVDADCLAGIDPLAH
jgi:hypothetical protein